MKIYFPAKQKYAFTIIEVLVSVVLISIVALGAVKLRQESRAMALYLSDRSKSELSNTLFLGKEVMSRNYRESSANALISQTFKLSDDASREILKESKRSIFISDPIKLSDSTLPIRANEIMIKGNYPARFFHFEAQ